MGYGIMVEMGGTSNNHQTMKDWAMIQASVRLASTGGRNWNISYVLIWIICS